MKRPIGFVAILLVFFSSSLSYGKEEILAFFNHNQLNSYTDPYYHRSRKGDDLEKVLLDTIKLANTSIDIAAYEFDLPLVAKVLAQKAKEGVKIRVVLDNTHSSVFRPLSVAELAALGEHERKNYLEFFAFADVNQDGKLDLKEIQEHDSLSLLQKANIGWIDDTADGSKGSGIMHHKFLVVDSRYVVTGSANFTRSCIHGDFSKQASRGNANSLLKIESEKVAAFFEEEFEQMWTYKNFGFKKSYRGVQAVKVAGKSVKLQFSPTSKKLGYASSTNGLISDVLEKGKKTAHLALFVFSEQQLADSLQVSGMQASALIDPSFATRAYSELLDMWGLEMKAANCKAEKGNAPWSVPAKNSGFTVLDDGDVLHHKFAVIDSSVVIVGSHNWSASANNQNDEALLVLEDSSIAKKYELEFDYLLKKSVIDPQPWLLNKIQAQEEACSTF